MAFSKIYLTASETSTNLFSQQDSKYYVYCKWEAACWKCKVRRFVYLIQNYKDLDFQFIPCRSTLYSKHEARCICKCSFLLQVSCGSAIQGALAAMPGPTASTLVSRALAFPAWPYTESHNTHFQFWACSANRIRESIRNKNNPAWPQSTVWDQRLC